MKKISVITESLWGKTLMRDIDDTVRIEDSTDLIVNIDGNKYQLVGFEDREKEHTEDSGEKWFCVAFDTPHAGIEITEYYFGNEYDFNDDTFDVYIARDMIENPNWGDELVKHIIGLSDIPEMEIKDVIKKYVNKLYTDKHGSELAQYLVQNYWRTDWAGDHALYSVVVGGDITANEVNLDEDDEFYESENEALIISFPMIDIWCEEFTKELTNVFEKYGWGASTTYEPDPYGDEVPGNTTSICFVKR